MRKVWGKVDQMSLSGVGVCENPACKEDILIIDKLIGAVLTCPFCLTNLEIIGDRSAIGGNIILFKIGPFAGSSLVIKTEIS